MPVRKTKRKTVAKRRNTFGNKGVGGGRKGNASEFDYNSYEQYNPGQHLRQLMPSLGNNRRMGFGALHVPSGMRPVSDFRRNGMNQPFIINPYGPPQPWIVQREEPPSSNGEPPRSRFGNSLENKHVNTSGYLSMWNGHPRNIPVSWNPLLYQGGDGFRTGINNPRLSQVDYY
jgi:hypothetical protein